MKTLKIGIVLLALLLATIAIVPIVSATTQTENSNQLLSRLKFNDTQEKQIIHDGFYLSGSNFATSNQNKIPFGSTIYHQAGITRVFDSSGKQLSTINDADSGRIATPAGYSPATNVYQVPNGALIKRNGEITQVIVNNQPISTIINTETTNAQVIPGLNFGGWVEQAKHDNIPDLGRFSAEWNAPTPPSNLSSTSVNFLFPGVMPQNQPSSGTTLIQPVLEWNNGVSSQCNQHWCARPWYITEDGGNFTTPDSVPVNTGDHISGVMDWNNDTQNWAVIITDDTNSRSLNIDDDRFWTNNLKVACALESYNIADNTDLPGSTTFTNMQFKDTSDQPVSFNWEPWYDQTALHSLPGLFVDTPSQSQVTLYTDKQYTISSSAGQNGTISPSGSVHVLANADQTFTITPDSGYAIGNVLVDGNSVGQVTSYTFSDVTTDHIISATFSPTSTGWNWATDGWGDWQHTWSVTGTQVGLNSEYGPVMVGDHGEHGTYTALLAGSTQSSVWKTFTDSSGSGWNTITFTGALAPCDVPGGRWIMIEVNGQQVFAATELQTPPGNAYQQFVIKRTFPQAATATVRISQGQNPAWGPIFPMQFYSLTLSRESNMNLIKTNSIPFVIPDGRGLVVNGTVSAINESVPGNNPTPLIANGTVLNG